MGFGLWALARSLVLAVLGALAVVVACGHPAPPPAVPLAAAMPRLLPPPPANPGARGATYLAQVALQLQPGWGQFLEDCRLRLPPGHRLNRMALATTAELAIDARGRVVGVKLDGSGDADFDRAVRDAIADAAPFAPPPADLVSDDDLVHLRWLFARDRRQAGPATAGVVDVELPLAGVVARRIAEHDLSRAARRIARAPAGAERTAAIHALAIATLREALDSADEAVRREAVEAVGNAGVHELAPEVRALIADTAPAALRKAATEVVALLRDRDAVPSLVHELAQDLAAGDDLAAADLEALEALGDYDQPRSQLRRLLDRPDPPDPIALALLGHVRIRELDSRVAGWLAHGDTRTRTAVCAAASDELLDVAVHWVATGLADPDARVRARCARSAGRLAWERARDPRVAVLVPGLRRVAHDRDRAARAQALAALVELDPATAARAADDPASEVRQAYALALAAPQARPSDLASLVEDRDPEVRAAAWLTLAETGRTDVLPDTDRDLLEARAASDPSPHVRRAVVPLLSDVTVLSRLADRDDDPEVQSRALVQLCTLRGRARCEDDLVARVAEAPAASAERVRAALAWLLAR